MPLLCMVTPSIYSVRTGIKDIDQWKGEAERVIQRRIAIEPVKFREKGLFRRKTRTFFYVYMEYDDYWAQKINFYSSDPNCSIRSMVSRGEVLAWLMGLVQGGDEICRRNRTSQS